MVRTVKLIQGGKVQMNSMNSTNIIAGISPLEGIRVLDFTHVISGPYCSMMLADMGADVLKIEKPKVGDDLRTVGRYEGRSQHDEDYFYTVNRRKRSIEVDLKDKNGKELIHKLALKADVIIENFSPGTAEKLGIGPTDLLKLNPKLVYCSISGFGQSGPLRNKLALDPIIQAMSGIMSVTGEPDDPPTAVGAPIADVVAGMFAAFCVVSALKQVERTGQGVTLDISMLDSMIAVLGPRMGEALQAHKQPFKVGNENPMRVPAGTFEAKDGRFISFIVQSQAYWEPFCRTIEHEEWIHDSRFSSMESRVIHRDLLNQAIKVKIKEYTSEEWLERFSSENVPCGPVFDYLGALNNPHINERGLIHEVEHPRSGKIKLVGPPWKSAQILSPKLTPPPLLGEHKVSAVCDWLGSDIDVREYFSQKV